MPMQSGSGLHGVPWHTCDRCGYKYPVSQLTRQNGLIVCTVKCVDQIDDRDSVIRSVLADSPNEMDVAEILKTPLDMEIENDDFVF
jgi:hypothetical protein